MYTCCRVSFIVNILSNLHVSLKVTLDVLCKSVLKNYVANEGTKRQQESNQPKEFIHTTPANHIISQQYQTRSLIS